MNDSHSAKAPESGSQTHVSSSSHISTPGKCMQAISLLSAMDLNHATEDSFRGPFVLLLDHLKECLPQSDLHLKQGQNALKVVTLLVERCCIAHVEPLLSICFELISVCLKFNEFFCDPVLLHSIYSALLSALLCEADLQVINLCHRITAVLINAAPEQSMVAAESAVRTFEFKYALEAMPPTATSLMINLHVTCCGKLQSDLDSDICKMAASFMLARRLIHSIEEDKLDLAEQLKRFMSEEYKTIFDITWQKQSESSENFLSAACADFQEFSDPGRQNVMLNDEELDVVLTEILTECATKSVDLDVQLNRVSFLMEQLLCHVSSISATNLPTCYRFKEIFDRTCRVAFSFSLEGDLWTKSITLQLLSILAHASVDSTFGRESLFMIVVCLLALCHDEATCNEDDNKEAFEHNMVLVADIRALACNEPEVVCDMLRDALRHIGQIRVGPSSFEVLRLAVLGVDAALMARVNYLPNRTDVIPPQLLMLAAEIGMQALEIENLKLNDMVQISIASSVWCDELFTLLQMTLWPTTDDRKYPEYSAIYHFLPVARVNLGVSDSLSSPIRQSSVEPATPVSKSRASLEPASSSFRLSRPATATPARRVLARFVTPGIGLTPYPQDRTTNAPISDSSKEDPVTSLMCATPLLGRTVLKKKLSIEDVRISRTENLPSSVMRVLFAEAVKLSSTTSSSRPTLPVPPAMRTVENDILQCGETLRELLDELTCSVFAGYGPLCGETLQPRAIDVRQDLLSIYNLCGYVQNASWPEARHEALSLMTSMSAHTASYSYSSATLSMMVRQTYYMIMAPRRFGVDGPTFGAAGQHFSESALKQLGCSEKSELPPLIMSSAVTATSSQTVQFVMKGSAITSAGSPQRQSSSTNTPLKQLFREALHRQTPHTLSRPRKPMDTIPDNSPTRSALSVTTLSAKPQPGLSSTFDLTDQTIPSAVVVQPPSAEVSIRTDVEMPPLPVVVQPPPADVSYRTDVEMPPLPATGVAAVVEENVLGKRKAADDAELNPEGIADSNSIAVDVDILLVQFDKAQCTGVCWIRSKKRGDKKVYCIHCPDEKGFLLRNVKSHNCPYHQ